MNGHMMQSSDYGGRWPHLAEKAGRIEADHRVLRVEHGHTRAHLLWLEAEHMRLVARVADETAARKKQAAEMRKALGSEMSTLRDRIMRGLFFLMVALGAMAVGGGQQAGELMLSAIKARLGV